MDPSLNCISNPFIFCHRFFLKKVWTLQHWSYLCGIRRWQPEPMLLHLQWLFSMTSVMWHSAINIEPDLTLSLWLFFTSQPLLVHLFTLCLFFSAVSTSLFFVFLFVMLLNKDVQRVLWRSPQAPVHFSAVALPAPLPLIAADAVAHLNVSVELECGRCYWPVSVPRGSNSCKTLQNQNVQNQEEMLI